MTALGLVLILVGIIVLIVGTFRRAETVGLLLVGLGVFLIAADALDLSTADVD